MAVIDSYFFFPVLIFSCFSRLEVSLPVSTSLAVLSIDSLLVRAADVGSGRVVVGLCG